ncbi:C40 family peptidase [Nocardia nova]|uniref:Peptidoglycan endopeptidase n=1 Tax=Nocardia nova TaxID=37330 RepID=A0A2S6A6C2_9NOCA|nr:C40 family peptidase [Nocardia nova]PPI93953.1 peptidoglycan endopeptidase [Nocardia nova]PPJ28028.1 peptidoglycan endopeptidase [Nocardia nova]
MSSRTLLAGIVSLPIALILFLALLVGIQPADSCATDVLAGGVAGSTGQSLAGLNERQLELARNGVAIGKQRQAAQSVIIAELAAMITESTLRNLANSNVPESLSYPNDGVGADHDSLGPHQMRVSVWGSAGIATLMNAIYQMNWFYSQAATLPGAASMTSAELAQAVEVSAPNAYAAQLDLAQRLYAMFADIDPASLPAAASGQPPPGCGPGSGPPGAPVPASGLGQAVVAAAQQWIGTPYVWGGGDANGPTGGGFDCSGLTLYAVYQASGGRIRLPHYTQAQQDDPAAHAVPFDQRQPGDLIFFTTAGESDSHHVAVYAGRDADGTDLVVHAPQTGQTVATAPLARVAGTDYFDVRRYSTPPPQPRNPTAEEGKHL